MNWTTWIVFTHGTVSVTGANTTVSVTNHKLLCYT